MDSSVGVGWALLITKIFQLLYEEWLGTGGEQRNWLGGCGSGVEWLGWAVAAEMLRSGQMLDGVQVQDLLMDGRQGMKASEGCRVAPGILTKQSSRRWRYLLTQGSWGRSRCMHGVGAEWRVSFGRVKFDADG